MDPTTTTAADLDARDRTARDRATQDLERFVGRLLIAVTYLSVALLIVGVAFMVVAGISPTAGGPGLDPATLPGRLARLEPDAFLWAGIITVIATPISRVVAAAVAFARGEDWRLMAVSIGILVTIAVGIAIAIAGS